MFGLLVVLVTVVLVAAPAGARADEPGPLGEPGPFVARVDTSLGSGVTERVGNGELELRVPAGVEVVARGFKGEPMAKVDRDGTVSYNALSPSWHQNRSSEVPPAASVDAEPKWVWLADDATLRFHDHRVHVMADHLDPAVRAGDDVFSFQLPFLVDGEPRELAGALVFAPDRDPSRATELVAGHDDPVAAVGSRAWRWVAAGAVAVVAAGVAFVVARTGR